MKIDIEKFSVDLTCRTSDLMDKANEWKLPKDSYYDFDTESEDQKQDEELKKKQQRTREYNYRTIKTCLNHKSHINSALHVIKPCLYALFVSCVSSPPPAYIKRVIAHPNFHNISFNQSEKMMETLDQGDLIIRPSSKGENHLTVTWKVRQENNKQLRVIKKEKTNKIFNFVQTKSQNVTKDKLKRQPSKG